MGNRLVINTVNFSTPKTQTKKNKIKQTPSFEGAGAAAVVNVMQAIENGGVAASFTIQDFLGLNIPRTIYNLFRNKDVTGELNKEASLETGLREFVTGPSMMVIPAVLFAATKNIFGKASDIKFSMLRKIGEHFEDMSHNNTIAKDTEKTNKELYKKVIKNTLEETFGKTKLTKKELSALTDSITDKALQMQKEKNKLADISRFKTSERKAVKKTVKEIEASILEIVAKKNKELGTNISTPHIVMFSSKTHKAESINLKNILRNVDKYSKDVVAKTITKVEKASKNSAEITEKHVKEFIQNTNIKRIGGRTLSTALAVLTVGGFSYFIPKIYSRSKKPPGETGLNTGGGNESN